MSGIAEVLVNLGYTVSGSDMRQSEITDRLTALGSRIFIGHAGHQVAGADVVVISSAVSKSNVEVLAARQANIPVIPRAEMLAELMRLKKNGIAIAGSHGKTTTTSLVGWLLTKAGLDPTVVIGGKVNSLDGSNAKLGEGEFLVAEADESDASFLKLSPVLVVVTNIDMEHLDYYDDIHAIKKTFLEFINKVPFYGATILCLDDQHITDILPGIQKRVITYGMTNQADIHAREITTTGLSSSFEVCRGENPLGRITLPLAGMHNVYNGLAAISIGLELDIPFAIIAEAMSGFTGVQRRLQVKGETGNILVVDDYAHHPTEIRATLAAMRDAWPHRRLVVLFQPHRYSRTKALLKEFHTAFEKTDILILTDIYSAGEEPLENISSETLLTGIRQHGHQHAHLVPSLAELPARTLPLLQAGDIVLTLGAGNIWTVGEDLLARMAGA